MKKITSITFQYEDGKTETFEGTGECRLVETSTEVEGKSQPQWPKIKYVSAHLTLREN